MIKLPKINRSELTTLNEGKAYPNEKLLKEYYQELFTCNNMPAYSDLTEENKRSIQNTTHFHVYQLKRSWKALVDTVLNRTPFV